MTLYDVIILGGGCAGLSAALWLSRNLPHYRVLVVEPRTDYHNDRTWCFWEVEDHPFTEAVSHRWQKWEVRGPSGSFVKNGARYPYCHIPADRFYRLALKHLESTNVSFRRAAAGVVLPHKRGVALPLQSGPVAAHYLLDSRPQTTPQAGLLQHFLGWHVRTAKPVFDANTLTLMDFSVDQEDGIHFFYVLPYSDQEALVEDTYISSSPLTPEIYRERVRQYLHTRFAVTRFELVREEKGTIPMPLRQPDCLPHPRILRIGTPGGCSKASSGYTFLAIQRQIRQLRTFFERGQQPRVRGWLTAKLDQIFLSFLMHHPGRAPQLFADLFRRTRSDRFVRFLSELAGWRDYLEVILASPKLPFLREAIRVGLP